MVMAIVGDHLRNVISNRGDKEVCAGRRDVYPPIFVSLCATLGFDAAFKIVII